MDRNEILGRLAGGQKLHVVRDDADHVDGRPPEFSYHVVTKSADDAQPIAHVSQEEVDWATEAVTHWQSPVGGPEEQRAVNLLNLGRILVSLNVPVDNQSILVTALVPYYHVQRRNVAVAGRCSVGCCVENLLRTRSGSVVCGHTRQECPNAKQVG